MKEKLTNFFMKIKPSKRKIIQVYAALLYNANIKGFISGKIFTGVSKAACLPGLNCYSCPGAIGACPLGSLQNALAESKTKLPTYVVGIILLYSIILGRTICGWLCPVGLFQELLYKIKSPKLRKSKVTRALSYFKYVLLVVLVILLPLIYGLQESNLPLPAFCKYICPAGTFEGAVLLLSHIDNAEYFGMLGGLFTWKFMLLIIFAVSSVFIYRFFCRFFCPLGAIYGLFNKLSIIGVKVDKEKCDNCQACINHCKMDVKTVGDHECIQCGECRKVCHVNAIEWKTIHKFVKDDLAKEEDVKAKDEEITENSEVNEIIEVKKSRKISPKLYNIISAIVASLILIVVLVVVNFQSKVYEINDICDDFSVILSDGSTFDISIDETSTLLYFYEEISNDEIDLIKSYSSEKLTVILVSDNITDQLISDLNGCNVKFIKSSVKEVKKAFCSEDVINYSVFMDSTDKILISKKELITEDDYNSIIIPCVSGLTVGNNVGEVCYNKTINIIGSDESFSVAKNKGKITIINFWYTSCTPCVQELPYFDAVYKEYSDVIEVIAIHEASIYNSNPESVSNFIANKFSGFTIKFGHDDEDDPYYTILGGERLWPMTVIVDQEGIIRLRTTEPMTVEILKNQIETLLNE